MINKITAVLFFSVLAAGIACADVIRDAGTKILEQYGGSVVTVKLVMQNKVVIGGREGGKKETKSDIIGTVISKDGLTVCSLGASDPGGLFSQLAQQNEEGGLKFSYKSKITGIKIRFASGEEVPGREVMRDSDLDLLFLEPKTPPSAKITYVNLAAGGKSAVLADVFILDRLGEVGNWNALISVARLTGMMEKPRLYYIPDESAVNDLGNPVFTADGKILGILVLKKFPGRSGGGVSSLLQGITGLGLLPVVLPAKDVLQIQKQIPPQTTAKK